MYNDDKRSASVKQHQPGEAIHTLHYTSLTISTLITAIATTTISSPFRHGVAVLGCWGVCCGEYYPALNTPNTTTLAYMARISSSSSTTTTMVVLIIDLLEWR